MKQVNPLPFLAVVVAISSVKAGDTSLTEDLMARAANRMTPERPTERNRADPT